MRTLSRLFILAVFLVFLGGCIAGCAFNKTLTLTAGNMELSIKLPSEFPSLQVSDFEYKELPSFSYIFRLCAYQEEILYGIIFQVGNPKAIAFFMNKDYTPVKWWIYGEDSKLKSVTRAEFYERIYLHNCPVGDKDNGNSI